MFFFQFRVDKMKFNNYRSPWKDMLLAKSIIAPSFEKILTTPIAANAANVIGKLSSICLPHIETNVTSITARFLGVLAARFHLFFF